MVYCFQVIPAENVVAAFQDSNTAVFATASTASDAQVYLEALEKGTDGIVLQTEDPAEVFALKVRTMVWFDDTSLTKRISVSLRFIPWVALFLFLQNGK